MPHTFNPNMLKADSGDSLSSMPAWSTDQFLGRLDLHRVTPSQNQTKRKEIKIWMKILPASYLC